MVDRISSTQSIPRMLADLCYEVEKNSDQVRRDIKKEIRTTKEDTKKGYADTASYQKLQASAWGVSAVATPLISCVSGLMLEQYQPIGKLISENTLPSVFRGIESYYTGKGTQVQAITAIGQKELDFLHQKEQDNGTLANRVQQIVDEARRDEKQAVSQG